MTYLFIALALFFGGVIGFLGLLLMPELKTMYYL